MMKNIVLLFLFAFRSYAQTHLEPADSYHSTYKRQHEYYSLVKEMLEEGYQNKPLARVVVRPSFTPEYIVSVDSTKQVYYLSYRSFDKNIYYSYKDKAKLQSLKKIEYRKPISPKLALLLNDFFMEFLSQTRYKEIEYAEFNGRKTIKASMSLDGENYIFSAYKFGYWLRVGQTWSPRKDTRLGKLVDFTDDLVELVRNQKNEEELYEEIKEFYDVLLQYK